MDPKSLLDEIYDEEFGFRLANFSIKPVHVANGLARALTERTYNTTALTRTLRRYVRNQKLGVDQERNPGTAILSDYAEAFTSSRGHEPDLQQLNRLRALAFEVFAADRAVFPDKSSFTLTNERFVTRDESDYRAGLFLARLLEAEPEDRADAAEYMKELLTSEVDPWTTLALPLLEFAEVREETGEGEAAARAARSDHLFQSSQGQMLSPTLRTLRDSCDRLARFERAVGSKLNSLRRLVLFGCFVIHVHAISRWSERQPGVPRPPILLDLFDGTVTSVRDASRATLRAAGDAIEGLILARFRERVANEYGETEKEIREAIDSSENLREVKIAFDNYHGGGMDAIDALAQGLVEGAFGREHPIGAAIELGRRAGFLSPWSNAGRGGKLQKRYTATAEFLETLIAATVEPDDPLEFPEFLDRLRDDFGIVVGRPQDDQIIRRNNLYDEQFGPSTAINEEDLRLNVEEMRKLVVESGYAKAYADGRTIVTTLPEGTL
jgi:hypothetical protein